MWQMSNIEIVLIVLMDILVANMLLLFYFQFHISSKQIYNLVGTRFSEMKCNQTWLKYFFLDIANFLWTEADHSLVRYLSSAAY